jgi:hypothetical protein
MSLRKQNRTLAVASASFQTFEQLESRRMFAANGFSTQNSLLDLIDPKVLSVAHDVQFNTGNELLRGKAARLDAQKRIQLNIQAAGKLSNLVTELKALGATVTEAVSQMRVVQAWVPADKVDDIAGISNVQAVRLPDYAIFNITSAGDAIHNADKVRAQFSALGYDGTGIKVGVISNGADHRANVGAELPTVTVDPAHPGSGDEGTAMLEIVHDLAPGAQLYFAGITNSTQMIPSIDYLVAQGCDVILDDVGFYGEAFFTDSAIAQHVSNVITNNDVVYVTSAGNSAGGKHYQAQYAQGLSATSDGRLHKFGGPGEDVNNITIPNGETFRAFLQWSDSWGGSNNNYDLYLYNSNTFAKLGQGVSVQDGQVGDLPFEMVQWTNNTGSNVQAQIWVEKKTTAAARELELFVASQGSLQFNTSADSLIGQEAVPGVISVAAASAGSPNTVESFSSRGMSTIYTNFATQTKISRQTLDGTGIDGVNTKIGDLGFFYDPFYGTSAASPHVGAIAALVRQANPSLSAPQVITAMADTATDLTTYGVGYDTTSGAGRYNALDAVYKVFTPSAPDLTAGSDFGVSSTDNITSDNTPTFTGTVPAGSLVRLIVDGVEKTNVQLGAGVTSYSMSTNLADGNHAVTIRVAANGTVSLPNNSNSSVALNVVIDTTAPTVLTKNFNWDNVPYQSLAWKFSEDISDSVNFQDLTLFNLMTNQTVNTVSSISPTDTAHFKFDQFLYGALPNGEYQATINAAGVTDKAGNQLAANSVLNFFYINGDADHDADVDINDLGILATNWQQSPRITSQGDFTYDGTVDVNDLGILATNWQQGIFAAPAQQAVGKSVFADRADDMLDLIA